jgi:hypothetical protein
MINEEAKGELRLILLLVACTVGLLMILSIATVIETYSLEKRISGACAADKEKPKDCLGCEKWEEGPHGGGCVDVCPPGKHCTKEGCKGCKGDAPSDCHECVDGKWIEKPGKETECHECVDGSWVGCEEHEICKAGKCKFDFESLKDEFKEELKKEWDDGVKDALKKLESLPPMSPDEFEDKALEILKDEAEDAIKKAVIETAVEITGIKKLTDNLVKQAWEKTKEFFSGEGPKGDDTKEDSTEDKKSGDSYGEWEIKPYIKIKKKEIGIKLEYSF